MDTTGGGGLSKKQQRSKQRLSEFQEAKRAEKHVDRWLQLIRLVCRQIRAKLLADTWTTWMRTTLCARAKLRSVLRPIMWAQWTRPSEQVTAALLNPPNEGSSSSQPPLTKINGKSVLGTCSPRDAYILRKARALQQAIAPHVPRAGMRMSARIGWLHQRPAWSDDSDEALEDLEDDDDHGGAPAAHAHPNARRKSVAAGLQTPGSQPRGRKKTRGRRSP